MRDATLRVGALKPQVEDRGQRVDLHLAIPAGMAIGIGISSKLPEVQLRRAFAVAVVVLGAAVGLENLLIP